MSSIRALASRRHLKSGMMAMSTIKQPRYIDLSISIENDVISDPPIMRPKIEYHSHKDTVAQIASFFRGLEAKDLPDGEAWAIENVQLTTHNGTHLDAPYHFHSTTIDSEGKTVPAKTIDEIPLEWCYANGVKLDFRHLEDGYVVQVDDVQRALNLINYKIQPFDIVLVNTSAGEAYGDESYLHKGCGVGKEATLYLLDQGVKITGTDAWSWVSLFL